MTPATVNHDLAVLSVLYNVARARWGYGTLLNPIGKGMRLKVANARNRRVSEEEFVRLFEAGLRYEADFNCAVPIRALIALAALTAMRQSELANLDWADVDLTHGTVLLRNTKNGRQRTVPLRTEAERILRLMGPRKAGRAFGNITGKTIGQAFTRVCARAGIEDLRFHDLRHEGTSRFFEDADKFSLTDQEIESITGHLAWAMLSRYKHLKARSIAASLQGGMPGG